MSTAYCRRAYRNKPRRYGHRYDALRHYNVESFQQSYQQLVSSKIAEHEQQSVLDELQNGLDGYTLFRRAVSYLDFIFDHPNHSLYSNGMTFLRCPMVQNITAIDADVVVLGLPFDMATSGRPGARLGPDAIRRASVHLAWEGTKYPWTFPLFEHFKKKVAEVLETLLIR